MIFTKLSRAMQALKQQAPVALNSFNSILFLNLGLYLSLRLLFLIWNYSPLKNLSAIDLLYAFLIGVRFDLAVAGPICALMLIFWLWGSRTLRLILITLSLLAHSFLILLTVADTVVIHFMGRRFTVHSLYLIGEGKTSNWFEYYQLFIFALILLPLYFYFTFKILNRNKDQSLQIFFKTKMGLTLVFLMAAVILGRGGFQEKPLSFINAKVINHPLAHQLILNSSFTFIKSFGRPHIERVHFFDQKKMLSLLNLDPTSTQPSSVLVPSELKPVPLNVVLILVESLSSEYLSPRITPFLSELSKSGVLFNPAYANGRRSVEGVAAVLSGIPALMEESFINSEFATNDFVGLGTLLKTQGFETSFFHGAQNGSMRFDSFTRAAGFDHYFGKKEFNDNTQDDGAWGIYDKPFLKFACEKMNTFKTPFASVMFTLSSHIPYHLPEDFKQKINSSELKDEIPMLKSIHYTDEALADFFACAQRQAWFKETLFIIMADHTGPELKIGSSFKSQFEIPILFYTADIKKLQGLTNRQLAQQIDILPTLTDLLGIPLLHKNHLARSLYQPGQKTIALFSDQKYELVTDQDPSLNEARLKAIRQYFSEGLYDNRLYFPAGQ